MVHSKLISEGSVQPLTYSQLRRIEKIDARKERDKALIEAGKEGIKALGQVGEGFFAGAGLGVQGFLSGDAAAFAAKLGAAGIFLAWLTFYYPHFAHATHLDALPFLNPETLGSTPPPPSPTGKFCFRAVGFDNLAVENCYDTEEQRSQIVTFGLATKRIKDVQLYQKP